MMGLALTSAAGFGDCGAVGGVGAAFSVGLGFGGTGGLDGS